MITHASVSELAKNAAPIADLGKTEVPFPSGDDTLILFPHLVAAVGVKVLVFNSALAC